MTKLQKIYSKAQRRRTPVPPQIELTDGEDDHGVYQHSGERLRIVDMDYGRLL